MTIGSRIPVDVILDNVVVGIISIDDQGTIQSFNTYAERLFQYTSDEVVGQQIDVLMPSHFFLSDRPSFDILEPALSDLTSPGRDGYASRKDGSRFPFELGINHMVVDGSAITVGIIRDISKRVEAQRLLLAERRRLNAVMETVVDGLIIMDQHFFIQSINPSAERIFGYENDEVKGQSGQILISDRQTNAENDCLFTSKEDGSEEVILMGREVIAKHKSGSVFPMELGINHMEVDGEIFFVTTVRDITDRKETELAIAESVELLKRSNKELDEFAYIASHDLKEPLRGLSNNSLFLEEDYGELLDDDGRKRLARMRYLCDRLEKLIDNLLYFSRLGRQELAVQNADVNELVADVVNLIQGSLDEANVSVRVPHPLPVVRCDVPRITEVFRNLITNALKYNDKDQKWIEVGTVQVPKQGDASEFEKAFYVKDNGIGIDPAFHDAVFRIFKRLNSEKDDKKGTGVGLTFVKKIVERHGGRIWIESTLGEGTTFFFTLKKSTTPHQVDVRTKESFL